MVIFEFQTNFFEFQTPFFEINFFFGISNISILYSKKNLWNSKINSLGL